MKNRNNILLSAIVGLIVGILTVLGQGVLPGNWNSLANSGTVWLLPAFFMGALSSTKGKSAISAIITLLGMVTGYYAYAMLIQNVSHSLYYILVWTVAAVIGGSIFGIAGYLWGKDRGPLHKYGSALIGGVFITEGLHLFLNLSDYIHMWHTGVVQIIVGVSLVLALERSNKERIASLLALIPIIVLGVIGYAILSLFA
ncbi:hypothetical protein FZC66_08975 [Priestia megaterium]|nr:hypothetical protein FZC66_08975 [Priestia megaterium]